VLGDGAGEGFKVALAAGRRPAFGPLLETGHDRSSTDYTSATSYKDYLTFNENFV